jgi:uncharacterized protein
MHFEIYRQQAGAARCWCWRLHDATQQVIASGEGYRSKALCLHAIDLVRGTSSLTPVIDETES